MVKVQIISVIEFWFNLFFIKLYYLSSEDFNLFIVNYKSVISILRLQYFKEFS